MGRSSMFRTFPILNVLITVSPLIAINIILLLNDSFRWFEKVTYGWSRCCMLFVLTAIGVASLLAWRVYREAQQMEIINSAIAELQEDIINAKEELAALGVELS
ncbi:hypothetical protein M514_10853 [Trichuris suis]|uniref:Uncharacterized protein n=1 Tax=Trichuris suis TaxID=68888 RepID=A0A085LTI0_9BILA|nr:hypothetical protein M513_10853 [Trichuris suis]KFD63268.1 hypothetical protein M514_10853 [Trichuris suis]KHJ41753.1 hypothetical protein D918_08124 [Trichuris suis]